MAVMQDERTFSSPRTIAERHRLKMSTVRAWITNRDRNGLARACMKIGKLVLVDDAKFAQWLDDHIVEKEERGG
jgi:hypothetical protein